jgi:hypothetical protein
VRETPLPCAAHARHSGGNGTRSVRRLIVTAKLDRPDVVTALGQTIDEAVPAPRTMPSTMDKQDVGHAWSSEDTDRVRRRLITIAACAALTSQGREIGADLQPVRWMLPETAHSSRVLKEEAERFALHAVDAAQAND